jgi:hypothetical protein
MNSWFIVKISTTNNIFQDRFKNPSDFFRKLSNSKLSLIGGSRNNNRIFFKRHFKGGVYYYIPNDSSLEIIFLIELFNPNKFDGIIMSLKSRIKMLFRSLKTLIEIEKLSDQSLIEWVSKLTPYTHQSQLFGESYKRGKLI